MNEVSTEYARAIGRRMRDNAASRQPLAKAFEAVAVELARATMRATKQLPAAERRAVSKQLKDFELALWALWRESSGLAGVDWDSI